MNGLPSQGILSSWRCSDSQNVHPRGKIAMSAMTDSAGATSVHPSRASDPRREIFLTGAWPLSFGVSPTTACRWHAGDWRRIFRGVLHQFPHARPLDQGVDARRRGIERFPGLRLAYECTVQLDLQDLGELGVNRS